MAGYDQSETRTPIGTREAYFMKTIIVAQNEKVKQIQNECNTTAVANAAVSARVRSKALHSIQALLQLYVLK